MPLLLEAVKEGSVYVHYETERAALLVRLSGRAILRSDRPENGALAAAARQPAFKVMGKLDIAEKAPFRRTGRVFVRVGGYDLDVRISRFPSQLASAGAAVFGPRGRTRAGVTILAWSDRA